MVRKREFERRLDRLEEIESRRDSAFHDVDFSVDLPDEYVEAIIRTSHKRLDGEELNDDETHLLRKMDAAAPESV